MVPDHPGKFEKIDLNNSFGTALDFAARARGFQSLLLLEETFCLIICDDTGENRSQLITIMSGCFFDRLDSLRAMNKSEYDLTLIRGKLDDNYFSLLFSDGSPLEVDPQCLAIWDESRQDWTARQ